MIPLIVNREGTFHLSNLFPITILVSPPQTDLCEYPVYKSLLIPTYLYHIVSDLHRGRALPLIRAKKRVRPSVPPSVR